MSLKLKLSICFITISLIFSLMVIGVWASRNVEINIGGSVSYEVEYNVIEGFTFSNTAVASYSGSETNVVIPSSYSTVVVDGETLYIEGDDYTVRSVGSRAFYQNTTITAVTLPSTITSIGSSAFYECSNLQSINFPSNLTTIGSSAFNGCSSLQEINLPSRLTSIGTGAFYECSSLQSLTLPSRLTTIGQSAFGWCSSLSGNLTIPSSVTSIALWAFTATNISSVTFANNSNLTDMGMAIFMACTNLTSVDFGDSNSITELGTNTFQDCTRLQTVDLGLNSKITGIPSCMFCRCTRLRQVYNIPDTIETIGLNSFQDCSSLTLLDFENPSISWEVCDEEDFSTDIITITASEFSGNYITLLSDTYRLYYWRRV